MFREHRNTRVNVLIRANIAQRVIERRIKCSAYDRESVLVNRLHREWQVIRH